MAQRVRDAYGARSGEYIELFGSLEQMHESDRDLIASWADRLAPGLVLDAGCGPGHWTAFLHERGLEVEGLDLTPEFIDHARARFADVPFRIGSIDNSGIPDSSVSGVLAWYSLIHTQPDALPTILGELHRMLTPGGGLLLGFFDGIAAQPFPHAVTTAYCWSVDALRLILDQAGFDVEASDRRQDPGRRPHAAISAIRAERSAPGVIPITRRRGMAD